MKKTYEDFVTVFFEGLMVCCINPIKNRFETALIRRGNHDFSVRIVKYLDDVKVDDNEYLNFPTEDIEFNFEGVGYPEVAGIRTYQSGSFDRKNESINDLRDVRWLVDLEGKELYDTKLEPTKESLSKHNMPLNKAFVKNAELFVDQITDYEDEIVLDDENGNEISREFFGKTAFVLGARINADNVLMDFSGSTISSHNVKRADGFNYKVFVTNTREGGDEQSELPVYHRVLKHSSGQQYNLEKIENPELQMYTRTGNCTKVFLSKTESLEGYS